MPFDLTAEIGFRTPTLSITAGKIRRALAIKAPVNLEFDPNAKANVRAITIGLRDLNKELKSLSRNARSARDSFKSLVGAVSAFSTGNKITEAERQMQGLYKTTRQTTSQLRSLKSASNIKSSVQATGITETTRAAQRLGGAIRSARTEVEEFGRISGLALRRNTGFLLATGAVFGFTRAVSAGLAEAIKFQSQLTKIAQVSQRSVSSLGALTKQITDLSVGLGVSSQNLSEVALTLAQADLSISDTEKALSALAKTSLAATFDDIQSTTEGAIAIMAQFGLEAGQLESALGSVNEVAAKFAVESSDIITAVQKAGSIFFQTSQGLKQGPLDTFNQFIATFSAVRATTRESADSIATGLRTIFARIQRPTTIRFLRELGIELTDLQGKFVGPFEAANRLSEGLRQLDPRSQAFAQAVEEIGGFRQVNKVLPLITSLELRFRALQAAQEGQSSLDRDTAVAQEALSVQFLKTAENFRALIREITETDTFKVLIKSVLDLTNGLIELGRAAKPIIPVIGALVAVRGASTLSQFFSSKGFFSGVTGRKFATGGSVNGPQGTDKVPALLTAGEFVINKDAAKKIGLNTLNRLNKVQKFQDGGPVKSIPIENFIGSKVVTPRIEIVLNVRDIRGNVTARVSSTGSSGAEVVERISGNNQSDLTESDTQRRARLGITSVAANQLRVKQIIAQERAAISRETFSGISVSRQGLSAAAISQTRRGDALSQAGLFGNPPANFANAANAGLGRGRTGLGPSPTSLPALTAAFLRQEEIDRLGPSFSGGSTDNLRSRLLRGRSPILRRLVSSSSFSRAGLGRVGSRILGGPGLLAAGIGANFLGNQIGGAGGAAVSGAGSGALVGSLAGPVGAGIGAIVGALNGFIQARLDERIQKASSKMAKSIDDISVAMEEFNRTGSSESVARAFNNLTETSIQNINNSSDVKIRSTTGGRVLGGQTIAQASERNLLIGQQLKSDLSGASQASRQVFDRLTQGQGLSVEDALKRLSPDQIFALQVGQANNRELSALGSQFRQFNDGGNNKLTPQLLQATARAQFGSSALSQTRDAEVELSKNLREVRVNTELFVEQIRNLSAAFDRASQAGVGFQRANEAILSRRSGGAGIRSQQLRNVFDNTRAFTVGEIGNVAGTLNTQLGNTRASRGFTGALVGARRVEANLPRVLNELAPSIQAGDDPRTLIEDAISRNFGDLPKVLRDTLSSSITEEVGKSPDRLSSIISGGDAEKFSSQVTKPLFDAGKQLIDIWNKNIADYENVLSTWVGLNREANQSLDEFNRLQIENVTEIKRLQGDRLTVGDRTAGANAQITALGVRAGLTGGFTVDDLINQEQGLTNRLRGPFAGRPEDIATEMTKLTVLQQSSIEALRAIAGNTSRQAALQEDLNSILDSRGQARRILEDFRSASPEEQQQTLRQVNLARLESQGVQLLGPQRADARAGRDILSAFVGATQGPAGLEGLDRRFLDVLGRDPSVNRLTGAAGVNLGNVTDFFRNRDPFFQGQLNQFAEAGRERERAQNALGQIDRRDANQFLQNGQDAFNRGQQALFNPGALLDRLNETLGQLPSEIAIGGQIRVDLNVNGAEVLGSLQPSIEKLISDKVQQYIRSVIPQDGPSSRPNFVRR